jgi:putative PIN family toxin of toxin-antitoxin system
MRIVLDTNLIVRGVGGQTGLGREILMQTLSERHTLVLSHSLFAEIRKVLHYPPVRALHGLHDADIQRFLDHLVAGSQHVSVLSYHIGPLVGLDPTDDMVLLTATAGQADILGTNNNHFYEPSVLRFAAMRGVRILRDVALIEELRRAPPSP